MRRRLHHARVSRNRHRGLSGLRRRRGRRPVPRRILQPNRQRPVHALRGRDVRVGVGQLPLLAMRGRALLRCWSRAVQRMRARHLSAVAGGIVLPRLRRRQRPAVRRCDGVRGVRGGQLPAVHRRRIVSRLRCRKLCGVARFPRMRAVWNRFLRSHPGLRQLHALQPGHVRGRHRLHGVHAL